MPLTAQEKPSPQGVLPMVAPVANASTKPVYETCSLSDLATTTELSLKQRGCMYRSRMLSKSFPVRAALFASITELRGGRQMRTPGFEDFAHRFETFYARRAAQNSGEFLAGYLHHEDPRYRPSAEQGIWKRTRSAMRSVVTTTREDGGRTMAFASLAGSFSSGLTSVACYRYRNSWDDGMRRSGIVYGFYVTNAIVQEFRPELSGFANRILHKR